MHETDHDQSVDRLDRVDAVAAGDRDAGRCADRFAAVQDAADRLHRQLVDRHADQRQREQRRAAHRVDVRDRVRCGDAAEVERIVDDRHEEVGGRDDRLLVVQPIHRRVVGRFDADEQLLRQIDARNAPCASMSRNTPGAILQPQPPPWLNWVKRTGASFAFMTTLDWRCAQLPC